VKADVSRALPSNGLHGIMSQKIKLFKEGFDYGLLGYGNVVTNITVQKTCDCVNSGTNSFQVLVDPIRLAIGTLNLIYREHS
jgi:hypothetical protein